MTEEQFKLVEPILDSIENDDLRELCIAILNDFPEYIWHVPASSSGKYHPSTDLGEGGLMRHQIAVARFCNWMLEIEQNQMQYSSRERDCMRIACLVHDGRKSGTENSGRTVFEHPHLMEEAIWNMYIDFPLLQEDMTLITDCIASHMGEWNTDKHSGVILPKPKTDMQKLVHLCDYLASRRDVEMQFDNWEKPELPEIETFVLDFGKYKGELLVDIAQKDMGYINWLKENYGREPVRSLVKKL